MKLFFSTLESVSLSVSSITVMCSAIPVQLAAGKKMCETQSRAVFITMLQVPKSEFGKKNRYPWLQKLN